MDLRHLVCIHVAIAQTSSRSWFAGQAASPWLEISHSGCKERGALTLAASSRLSGAPATDRHAFASQWEACLMGGHHAFIVRSSSPMAQTQSQMLCAPQSCHASSLQEVLVRATARATIEVVPLGCWSEGQSPEDCCTKGPECWENHPLGPSSGYAFTGLLARAVQVCCGEALKRSPYEVLMGFFNSVAYSLPGRLYVTTSMTVHVATLRVLASHGTSVIELGVQFGESSWGLLMGLVESSSGNRMRRMVSVDVEGSTISATVHAVASANNVSYRFLHASSLHVTLRPADLIFIDDLHAYAQVRAELAKYAPLAVRYIVLHDTVSHREHDECSEQRYRHLAICTGQATLGIYTAVVEFLEMSPHWFIRSHTNRSAGLTVLERRS
mmetsp:Transcript_9528/g.17702  ORF Transcript_9528/g.17702 Transcript_9528/m.17702 type:complete len:384 (-) Transcript_9528:39-1190(-)